MARRGRADPRTPFPIDGHASGPPGGRGSGLATRRWAAYRGWQVSTPLPSTNAAFEGGPCSCTASESGQESIHVSGYTCRLLIIANDAGLRSELRRVLAMDPEKRYAL